ncbi:hypothetical protein TWF506_005834 [Arthrobotrys conoides]|uniref:Nucleoside phosphorylase domain-containing protein n=1 Tax=Arthrobotrys conoides TaxID=74498 RepID=A0AAN8S3W2_9PEZI
MTARRSHDDYTVGWICALPKEQTAAMLMLDEEHEDLINPLRDKNVYTLGAMGLHNVVITCLPIRCYGTNQMATTAAHMAITFPSIKITLMVGIGAGIPSKVKLGDVVISTEWIQWDLGKAGRGFELNSRHYYPPKELSAAMSKLQAQQNRHGTRIPQYLEFIRDNNPYLPDEYTSVRGQEALGDPRKARVHYGLIASGNQVVKNAQKRDEISESLKNEVFCIEMEAAGLVDCPATIVRGICDYADSAKNDDWQEYAAVLAAICAKELLKCVQPSHISSAQPMRENLQQGLGVGLQGQSSESLDAFISRFSDNKTYQREDHRPSPSGYDRRRPESEASSSARHQKNKSITPDTDERKKDNDTMKEAILHPGVTSANKAVPYPSPAANEDKNRSGPKPRATSANKTASYPGPAAIEDIYNNRSDLSPKENSGRRNYFWNGGHQKPTVSNPPEPLKQREIPITRHSSNLGRDRDTDSTQEIKPRIRPLQPKAPVTKSLEEQNKYEAETLPFSQNISSSEDDDIGAPAHFLARKKAINETSSSQRIQKTPHSSNLSRDRDTDIPQPQATKSSSRSRSRAPVIRSLEEQNKYEADALPFSQGLSSSEDEGISTPAPVPERRKVATETSSSQRTQKAPHSSNLGRDRDTNSTQESKPKAERRQKAHYSNTPEEQNRYKVELVPSSRGTGSSSVSNSREERSGYKVESVPSSRGTSGSSVNRSIDAPPPTPEQPMLKMTTATRSSGMLARFTGWTVGPKPYEWSPLPFQSAAKKTSNVSENTNIKFKSDFEQEDFTTKEQISYEKKQHQIYDIVKPQKSYDIAKRQKSSDTELLKAREQESQPGFNEITLASMMLDSEDEETTEEDELPDNKKSQASKPLPKPSEDQTSSDLEVFPFQGLFGDEAEDTEEVQQKDSSNRRTALGHERNQQETSRPRSERSLFDPNASQLSLAIEFGSARKVRSLLNQGADLNAVNPETGLPPLAFAGKHPVYSVIDILLSKGAHVDLTGRLPQQMLKVAGGKKDPSMIFKSAVDGTGEFRVREGFGEAKWYIAQAVLFWAMETAELDVARWLIHRGIKQVDSLSLEKYVRRLAAKEKQALENSK